MSEDLNVTALVDSSNGFLSEILNTSEIDKAINLLKKLDVLKTALKAADTFRSQSICYAKLEANALVKIIELGGIKYLRGNRRKAAEWLFEQDEKTKNDFIAKCEDGLLIEQVYVREIVPKLKSDAYADYIEIVREDLEEKLEKEKYVVLDDEIAILESEAPSETVYLDTIDGLRNWLRKKGAVGIGDSKGTYFIPSYEATEYMQKAIMLRIESICKDLSKLKELADITKAKISFFDAQRCAQKNSGCELHYFDRGMQGTSWASVHKGKRYICFFMLVLSDLGLFEDEEDFWKDLICGLSSIADKIISKPSPCSMTNIYDVIIGKLDEAFSHDEKETCCG